MFDDDFKELVQLELFIYHCYSELYELEIDGLRNSSEYINSMNSLKKLLDNENVFINNIIGNNIEMCKRWLTYVGSFKYENSYIDLINVKSSEVVGKRLYGKFIKLYYKLLFNDINNFIMLNHSIVSIGKEKSLYELYDSLKMQNKLLLFLEIDFVNSLLYFINEEINVSNYSNNLIKAKYDFTFIHSELEQNMIDNSFEINNNVYSIIQMFLDCNNISYEMVYSKILNYYLNIFSNNIDYLVYQDSDYTCDKYMFNKVLMDCFIKCSLIYLDEYDILRLKNIVNDEYNNFINNGIISVDDRISINNITDVFNFIDDVKKKVNIISFK